MSSEKNNKWPQSIAVIGAAGTVGSSVAAHLAMGAVGETLYLIDVRENVVESHVIDIGDAQALGKIPRPRVISGAPVNQAVDLLIVAASRPEAPSDDRRDYVKANAELLQMLRADIERLAGTEGIVLLLTNPVDVLATWLSETSEISAERIVGYCLNDSARFVESVARTLQVDVDRVAGQVLGEHGSGQVPIFSGVTCDGVPVTLDASQEAQVRDDVFGWFERWSALSSGRSSGWATGAGVLEMVYRLCSGSTVVGTSSAADLPGFATSHLGLETQLHTSGIEALEPQCSPAERAQLESASERVRADVEALKGDMDA